MWVRLRLSAFGAMQSAGPPGTVHAACISELPARSKLPFAVTERFPSSCSIGLLVRTPRNANDEQN